MGYYKAEKWMDELRYIGIPVYVRLHGFKKPEEKNRITPTVLHNVWRSRTANKFMSGMMTKIGFNTMDVKTLGILIPVAIGIVIGMFYFMGGF